MDAACSKTDATTIGGSRRNSKRNTQQVVLLPTPICGAMVQQLQVSRA
jgi:hypothetical protein